MYGWERQLNIQLQKSEGTMYFVQGNDMKTFIICMSDVLGDCVDHLFSGENFHSTECYAAWVMSGTSVFQWTI